MADNQKIDQARKQGVFDLRLVGEGDLSLQQLIDFVKDVMPDTPFSKVKVGLSPDDLGVRLEKMSINF